MNARRYQEAQDQRRVEGMTREEVCARWQGRILRRARVIAERSEGAVAAEDLAAYGMLGLLEAFDRYAPEHQVDFATFAEFRVTGALHDALRGAAATTRRERRARGELRRVTEELTVRWGRAPAHHELAEALGLDLEAYWHLRELAEPVVLEPLTGGEPAAAEAVAPRLLLAVDARAALRTAIERLPERERLVIQLYYGRDCSLAEVGAVLDVSASRVCQILGDARARLRKHLGQVDLGRDDVALVGAA